MNSLVEGMYFLDGIVDVKSDLAIQIMNQVKPLMTLPDGNMTIYMAADYFEVKYDTIRKSIQRNRDELLLNGMTILSGQALRDYKNSGILEKLSSSKINNLILLDNKAMLNIALLLKESPVAQQIRLELGIEYIPRKELIFKDLLIQMIREVFNNDERLELLFQYNIDNIYRIDFYFPRIKLAVEYDELGHLYSQEQDLIRQQYIEQYGINFIRVKYNDEISGIYNIINYIQRELYAIN